MTNESFKKDLENFLTTHSYQEKKIKNSRIKYIISGKEENPSIVFLNGLNMQEMWIKYVEAFEKNYRVLLLEYPITPRTNNELLDIIAELLKELHINKPFIIGASDGGMHAQLFVRRFPNNVSGLVLATTVTLDSSYAEDIRKEGSPKVYQFIFKLIPYYFLKKRLVGQASSYMNEESSFEQEYGKSFLETIAMDKYYKKKFIHIFGIVNEFGKHEKFTTEEFEPVRRKILVMVPEKDLFTKEDQDKLISLLPEPEVHHMRGGHLSFIMCYQEYIEIIQNFLRKINYV